MAKQTGLYGIRGKVGEYKYYGMKGVDGTIMAKQNEGMSERVKTDAAYENTRRNNSEFGLATSTAGAVVKAFSQRWRYLLVAFATAKIAKDLLALGKATSSSDWGNRVLSGAELAPVLPATMQKFVKNDINDFSPINANIGFDGEHVTATVSADDITNAKAIAGGCDGVRVVLVKNIVDPATGGYSEGGIVPASCISEELGSADASFGQDITLSGTYEPYDGTILLSIVLLPYRTVGSNKHIMQEFCSAKFVKG